MSETFVLNGASRSRVLGAIAKLEGPHKITCKPLPNRSAEQSAKLYACLQDIAEQVEWFGQHYDRYAWKDILTAGLKKQRIVPGIDGGWVLLGDHTSDMSVAEMVELLEFVLFFGTEKGVIWGAEATGTEIRESAAA